MDRVAEYQKIILDVLTEHSNLGDPNDTIRDYLICDKERHHYQILGMGWQNKRRVLYPSIHINIVGDKVWLQNDMTDVEIAAQLVERGIPKEHIVLGFKPEHVRPHTGFAVK